MSRPPGFIAGARWPFWRRGLCALLPMVLALLVSSCGALSGSDPRGEVIVVGPDGAPLKGAVVIPDPEFDSNAPPKLTDSELEQHATNAQGVVLIYLDDFYWGGDACYHIRVHLAGYEDEAVTVSKDLLPAVLKIDMRPKAPATNPPAAARHG